MVRKKIKEMLFLIRNIMIQCWSIQMFLYDGDMSYLSYSAYYFNILYIPLL